MNTYEESWERFDEEQAHHENRNYNRRQFYIDRRAWAQRQRLWCNNSKDCRDKFCQQVHDDCWHGDDCDRGSYCNYYHKPREGTWSNGPGVVDNNKPKRQLIPNFRDRRNRDEDKRREVDFDVREEPENTSDVMPTFSMKQHSFYPFEKI